MNLKFVTTIALALGSVFTIAAQEIKVDISNTGRPLSEGLDPAFTAWSTNQNWFAGGDTTSNNFNGIGVKFTRVGSVGIALQPNYWKAGVQSTTFNAKLTGDGIKVDTGDAGAQIEMRLSGLSAGNHTLLIYHNVWDGLTAGNVAPLDIYINGTLVIDNLPMSIRVTNTAASATAYLNLTAVAGQDVVVLIKAETSGGQSTKNVYINGFEIDTENTISLANSASPANADEHVDADSHSLTLTWSPATSGLVLSHDVYFGTSSNAVKNATHASPEFKGNQAGTSYPVSGINSLLTYFWRVDEIASSGTTKGNLWYFRPRHLAFPGAEGYGRFARGGRGGVVREVTNTNDSGSGSFRDAIEGNYGPRTVVFTVSGQIILNDDVIITGTTPPITVAGQTAPGKGICFRRQQFAMNGAVDAIVRDVRVRVGKESGETQNGSGMSGVDHAIMDHCSISWGIDEELSTRNGKNLSFQRCHISEALNIAGHQNYPAGTEHGYAASIGGDVATFHHNLLTHNEGRNWSLAGGLNPDGYYSGRLDIFNNVVYNWGSRATDGGAHEVNFVNNYYKPGAGTDFFYALNAQYDGFPGTQQYYFAGNVMPGHFQLSNESAGREATPANGSVPTTYSPWVTNAFFPSYATIDEVTNAYKKVLSDVGCNQPVVDDHDIRVIRETIDGTYTYTGTGPYGGRPGMPNTTDDVGGWENYGTAVRPADWDTDHDGLPNWWEVIKGLNTNSAPGDYSDANADLVGDEYTELDRYLNWMAEPHADCNAGTNVDIDLATLTRGFTNSSPKYLVFGAVNGTVVTNGNGKTARFTPATSVNALGYFTYTVTDNKGYNMTQTVGIRIIGSGASPTNAPDAPTGLSATAGDTQVSLSWNAALNATSYIIKRATVDGGPYTPVATNASPSYVNADLANGTTYYYVVMARNVTGDSGDSSQASATPQLSIPPSPISLVATGGNAQVSLSWTASAGATGYIIKRSTMSGSGYVSIFTNATTGYTNTGLINGTTYYYVVTATNAAGESANSPQASTTPQIPAPTGLSATAGNAQVALSWSASAGAASYLVKRSTTSGSGYVNIVTNATTTYTNIGLANNTAYYYVVSAVNGASESTNSSQVSATPVAGGAITIVDAPNTVVTGSSATTVTTPVTVSPRANALVVLINNMKETATGAWTVTWNGQTLANAVVLQSGSTGAKSCIYYLYNPTTDGAAHNLSCTFTAAATGYHIQYFTLSGVDTTVAPLIGSANANAATETFTIPGCPLNGLAALNAVNSSSGTTTTLITAFGSGTLTATNITGSSPSCSIGYANLIAAGSDTFTATASVSGKFAFTAAVFTPAGLALGNTAPILPSIPSRTINVGANLLITNNATDADAPLVYSLPVAPANAAIGPFSGIFNWRPQVTQANTTNTMMVVVTDNGSPSLSATQSFSVIVNPLTVPTVTAPQVSNGQIGLTVNGQVGPDYAVQGSSNLVDWSTLLITNPTAMPFSWSTNTGPLPSQFYRIKVGPPLP